MNDEELSVVITDSGLGGLSVAAELYERLKKHNPYKNARLVFFDCRPSNTVGYDRMKSDERRHRVFSNALTCMEERFSPDAILIACNTLSVFYDKTPYAKTAPQPVHGIVECGVEMIEEYFNENSDSKVVLFATETTIKYALHKRLLAEKGCKDENTVYQCCPNLANLIERRFQSPRTNERIKHYCAEASAPLKSFIGKTALALLCTHFGYRTDDFVNGMKENGIEPDAVMNPNSRMVDDFMEQLKSGNSESAQTRIEVYTQSEYSPETMDSISHLFGIRSLDTVEALKNSHFIPEMFSMV